MLEITPTVQFKFRAVGYYMCNKLFSKKYFYVFSDVKKNPLYIYTETYLLIAW